MSASRGSRTIINNRFSGEEQQLTKMKSRFSYPERKPAIGQKAKNEANSREQSRKTALFSERTLPLSPLQGRAGRPANTLFILTKVE